MRQGQNRLSRKRLIRQLDNRTNNKETPVYLCYRTLCLDYIQMVSRCLSRSTLLLSLFLSLLFILPHAAFQHSDLDSLAVGSLAPGPGDFPSISNLDQSLTLPSFPQARDPQAVLPSIGEQVCVCCLLL